MEAEEEERESRREGEVKLKSWEEVKSQLAPVDLAKPNTTTVEEKYKLLAPESMQETFMSDSEDEGGK